MVFGRPGEGGASVEARGRGRPPFGSASRGVVPVDEASRLACSRRVTDLLVFGGSGYSGLELLRWLMRHPSRVMGASSDRWTGRAVADLVPGAPGDWRFSSHADLLGAAQAGQIAFLATPAESSARLAPALLARGLRVIDLSGGFRLPAEAYPEWYGFEHPAPAWLSEAEYGLPEIFDWPDREVRLVANPGCYATAAVLAAGPLARAGLIEGPLFLDGKSGTTGAGRKADDALSFSEVGESLRPYRVGRHQHTPEIEAALSRVAGREVRVSFTPHLVPMTRGLLVTAYGVASSEATPESVAAAFRAAYGGSTLIRFEHDELPSTGVVRGTPFTRVYAHLDVRTGTVQAGAALDNLLKGAASQAIQNLNRLLDLPLETGLARSGGAP